MLDHLSPSSLSQFLQCGEQWRLERVERVPKPVSMSLLVGSAMHTGAETYWKTLRDHKTAMSGEAFANFVVAALSEAIPQREIIVPEGEDKSKMIQDGLDKVRRLSGVFISQVVPEVIREGVPFLVEHETRIEPAVPELPPIVTRIDWQVNNWIYDLKITARQWPEEDVALDDQFTAYCLAATVDNWVPKGVRVVFLLDQKIPKAVTVETYRTDQQVMCLLEKYKRVWSLVQAGAYPPAAQGWWCTRKYCGYAHANRCQFFAQR